MCGVAGDPTPRANDARTECPYVSYAAPRARRQSATRERSMPTTTISTSAQRTTRRASARRVRTRADALRDTGVTREGLRAAEKRRVVVELDGLGKVLIQEFAGDVYAVSNKCPHLGLSLQGKTPLLSATVEDGAIVCPAHGSAFDLKTGAAKGEWCPKLPALPVVGKKYCGEPTAIASYAVSVDESGAIKIDA